MRSGSSAAGGHPVRDAGRGDLLLRPGDPGGHRRLADQEGARDLGRGQPAQQPQGQRDLRLDGERRVAAGEDQPQPVVGDTSSARPRPTAGSASSVDAAAAALACSVASRRSRSSARCRADGGQPGRRAGAGCRRSPPRGQRLGVGVLDALLGEVEVAGDAHRRGEHEGPLATVRVGDRGGDRWQPGRHVGSVEDHDRADLDAAEPGRDLLGDGDRRVEVGGLDEVVAAERLLGLGERPVGDGEPAAPSLRMRSPSRSAAGRSRRAGPPRCSRRTRRVRLGDLGERGLVGVGVARPRPRRSGSGTATSRHPLVCGPLSGPSSLRRSALAAIDSRCP